MNNIINFNGMQAIILNPKLLALLEKQEKENKKFEEKMDRQIKKENGVSKA